MKKIKYLLFVCISMMMGCGLSSCSSDGYSLGDIYRSIVTVHVDDQGYAKSFDLGNGQTMYVTNTASNYKPVNERTIINYTILGDNFQGYDYAIKLNGYLEDILTKSPIYIAEGDKEEQDKVGYNKIKVFSLWAQAGYINVRFGYNMAGKDQHTLNLVAMNENLEQVAKEPIKLQLRHNIGKDEENYASPKMHVCFRLDKYLEANKGNADLAFEVSWVEYDGQEKKEILKYPALLATANPPAIVE